MLPMEVCSPPPHGLTTVSGRYWEKNMISPPFWPKMNRNRFCTKGPPNTKPLERPRKARSGAPPGPPRTAPRPFGTHPSSHLSTSIPKHQFSTLFFGSAQMVFSQ